MPLVHPTHVVSFSSEDQYHPASNLLNRETYRKWKCKDAGEKEAFVILKFEKAESINAVDIGNDGSALVEVLVARSGNGGEPEFEVLLSSTAFMSPGDSRDGKNLNGVRTFSLNSLSKPIAAQKWDLVKILVSQPFNKHVQYGLTFVKFVSAPDPNEPKKIGGFGFRTAIGGADSDEEDARPGRLFSSFSKSPKKESGTPSLGSPAAAATSAPPKIFGSSSTNSEIRDTVAKLAGAAKSKTDHEVKDILKKSKPDVPSPSSATNGSKVGRNNSPVPNRQLPDPSFKSKKKDDTANRSAAGNKSSSAASSPTVNKSTKKRQLSPAPTARPIHSPTPSSSKGATAPKQKKAKKTKPFNKLFEGVVFSMSGFQNPLRGQLRDKAVEMGARYKADWDRTCTHLICAFYNTPKFNEVRTAGNGNIVKKNWIEECYNNKCRYPWRRYCLDRDDKGSESEDEIFTESNDNDDEELLDEEPMQTNENSDEEVKTKRKRVMVMDSSDESEHSNDSKKAYDKDTDVDDDKTPDLSPSMLTESESYSAFFENKGFCLQPSVYDANASEIPEMIKKHKGQIHKTLSDTVEYYVCNNKEWTDDYADAFSDNPNLTFIHEDWILQCHSEDCLVDVAKFLLTPH